MRFYAGLKVRERETGIPAVVASVRESWRRGERVQIQYLAGPWAGWKTYRDPGELELDERPIASLARGAA